MAREPKCRRVESLPKVIEFKPVGIPRSRLQEKVLKVEELEAIRLKDLLGLEQEECAQRMGVSRPTFQRILTEGRAIVAGVLIEGQALRVEGGDYCLGQDQCRKIERYNKDEACPYWNSGVVFEPFDRPSASGIGTNIAVCGDSDSPSAQLDGRFGRCAYFLLWDKDYKFIAAIGNDSSQLKRGAGTEAVRHLLHRDVGVLICNHIGPNALTVFRRAGGKVYGAVDNQEVQRVLQQYQAGELPLMETANNESLVKS